MTPSVFRTAVLGCALAVRAAGAAPLDLAVDPQASLLLKGTVSGVHVIDVETGATVYALNPDELRVVASNTKLFTTAAALDTLGPGHFFETRFALRGRIEAGVLTGDLGVVGAGDPQISGREFAGDSLAVFRPWARALKARGIRKVQGDLYLAHGLFEAPVIHPDWPRDQLTEWYEAPVDALSFNDNCVLVRVSPGAAGRVPKVEVLPAVDVLTVENTAVTRTKRRGPRLLIQRVGTRLLVRGSVPHTAKPYETWVTVPDPVLYFGAGLRAALAEEGVEVTGSLRPVKALPGNVWERVAVHRSDLLTAVRTTNKRSQNFYAEALAKVLGARLCGEGSWNRGVRAIAEFIEGIGIPRGSFSLADGSGMSRKNRFTPRQITHLLRTMYQHPRGGEFMRSLPYSGEVNGGWRQRLAAPPYAGNVMAKTGTLSEVSALSGYARAVSGKLYAFSILINKANGKARAAQDRLVMTIIDNG